MGVGEAVSGGRMNGKLSLRPYYLPLSTGPSGVDTLLPWSGQVVRSDLRMTSYPPTIVLWIVADLGQPFGKRKVWVVPDTVEFQTDAECCAAVTFGPDQCFAVFWEVMP